MQLQTLKDILRRTKASSKKKKCSQIQDDLGRRKSGGSSGLESYTLNKKRDNYEGKNGKATWFQKSDS